MKKIILFVLSSVIYMSCQQKDAAKPEVNGMMKEISVSCTGIEFSKSINDADKYYTLRNGCLTINGFPKTNYFNAPDGSRTESTAPVLLTEVDNTLPFTFTVKLRTPIEKTYDAGAVYIYLDNDNWLKYAFELDERHRKRVVTVRTHGTSDDNNHDIVEQDSIYMKISSSVKQIGLYYSIDGEKWNLARLFKNEYPSRLWIGISSQSPGGKGNITVFENMSLTQDCVKNYRLGI